MNDLLQELSRITRIILESELDYPKLTEAINSLKRLFLAVSEMDLEDLSDAKNIQLESGNALGRKWAAMCVEDFMRTKRFICGVKEAIDQRKSSVKNNPLTILYAGTGPFATLLMPLISVYTPEEMQWILLEVNPQSYASLKKTIAAFNAESYIKEMHECDATKFKLSSELKIDILVVECLQHSLVKEPQVAITYNLISQLPEDVILIPQEIRLDLSFFNGYISESTVYQTDKIETVFCLNKEDVKKHCTSVYNSEILFSEKITEIPESDFEDAAIVINTDITVFNEHRLLFNESGLTIPNILGYQSKENEPKQLKSQYICGKSPGLKTEFVYGSK